MRFYTFIPLQKQCRTAAVEEKTVPKSGEFSQKHYLCYAKQIYAEFRLHRTAVGYI